MFRPTLSLYNIVDRRIIISQIKCVNVLTSFSGNLDIACISCHVVAMETEDVYVIMQMFKIKEVK